MTVVRVILTGRRFGRLMVVEDIGRARCGSGSSRLWRCACDCGGSRDVITGNLTSGNTVSCGCFRVEMTYARSATHADSRSPEHRCWAYMKTRCTNPSSSSWKNYGARGITVCERWASSYENFLADMGRKPSPSASIDRIDSDGNYEPGNCRWATRSEQRRNQRKAQR